MNAFGAAMLAGDMTAVSALLRPDVTFSSPAVFQPYRGRTATLRVLAAAAQTFEDFAYTAEMHGPQVDVLRFRARVGRFELEGVDILTTGEDGQITDITVMVRPLRALEALMAAMQQALARQQDSDFLWKMAPGSRGPASHLSPTPRIRPWVWMRHPAHPIVQGATFIPQKSLKPGGQVPPGRAPADGRPRSAR